MTSSLLVTKKSREFTPGIHWILGCRPSEFGGQVMHAQFSAHVVVGTEKAAMIDGGLTSAWESISESLDSILAGRQLDWFIPSHAEIPHAGNLPRILRKYPKCLVIGDVRDYHLYYPEFESRLLPIPKYSPLDLGGGYALTLLDAPIKDAAATQWVYESKQQVLFVSDAFNHRHSPAPDGDETDSVHRAGECGLMTSELRELPLVEHAQANVRLALGWTRYMDATPILNEVVGMMERYPTRFVPSSHGNVIDNFAKILPIMRKAYDRSTPAPDHLPPAPR
jgi:glyoxylase-like metal-dependent hydrolase (beta-lactamase superfamily II)